MAGSRSETLDLVGAYRLPASLAVTVGCLGKSVGVMIGGLSGKASLPGFRWDDERPVLIPPEVDPAIAAAFARRIDMEQDPWIRWNYWGSVSSWHTVKRTLNGVHVGAILLRFSVPAANVSYTESQHGRGQLEGPARDGLYSTIDSWFDLVRAWIETAVDQDTDPVNPLTNVITPGKGLMVVTKEEDVVSFPSSPHHSSVFATRHETINLPRLRKAFGLANAGRLPSDAHLLLRDARAVLRRSGNRRAVIDAGTAVELTLAAFNRTVTRVNTGTRPPTLGWYVDQPTIASRAALPVDLKRDLVTVRNDAIHQNVIPTRLDALRALELAQQVVAALDPLPL